MGISAHFLPLSDFVAGYSGLVDMMRLFDLLNLKEECKWLNSMLI